MNNDLISREALKSHILYIFDEEVKHDKMWAMGLKYSLKIIDKAPTVDLWEMRQEATENALKKAEELYKRPQGEWKFLKANEEQTDGYECSVCKTTYHTRVPYFSEFNFCPNCGAEMKGGGEDGQNV